MIDINKKYQTRAGLPVRILCTDRKGDHSVVGLVGIGEVPHTFTENGYCTSYPAFCLVSVPEVTYQYKNVYQKGVNNTWDDLSGCRTHRFSSNVAGPFLGLLKQTLHDGVIVKTEFISAEDEEKEQI